MGKYRLDVTLKQYTPLIHFQGDEDGACLRASEVKPKLDRFVVEYLERQGTPLPAAWKLSVPESGEILHHPALQYKMRFEGIGSKEVSSNYKDKKRANEIHPLYFASMGDETSDVWDENGVSKVKGVFYPDGVRMSIISVKHPDLLALLEKLIPPFFLLHCFGNRSNKGFGSFSAQMIAGKRVRKWTPEQLLAYLPNSCKALYYAEYAPEDQSGLNAKTRLDDIQGISAIMKGGMNYSTYNRGDVDTPYYYKGAIFKYFMEDQKVAGRSEKAKIKRDILPCPEEDKLVSERYGKKPFKPDDRFFYMRGVLGIGQTFEYRRNSKNSLSHRSGKVTIEGSEKGSDGKPVIARFENPVHFHPYDSYLLLIPQEIPEKMFGAPFDLKAKNRQGTISLPSEFDLDDFLWYFIEEYEKSEDLGLFCVDPRDRVTRPVRMISNLLNRIEYFNRVAREKGGK